MDISQFILSLFIKTSYASPDDVYMTYHTYGMNPSWGIMVLFFILIFWIAIISFVVTVLKNLSKSNITALDILKERYAKGEINKKEFDEKKNAVK